MKPTTCGQTDNNSEPIPKHTNTDHVDAKALVVLFDRLQERVANRHAVLLTLQVEVGVAFGEVVLPQGEERQVAVAQRRLAVPLEFAQILAAKRAGIKEIILSNRNKKDLDEISEVYLKGLKLHLVETAQEVIDIALLKQKVENPVNFILPLEAEK